MDYRKVLVFHRGKSPNPFRCENGDVYDSTAVLFRGFDMLYYGERWNTDHTESYKGGRLAKGRYYGIVGPRAKDGLLVIKLFRATADELAKIKTHADLTEAMMTLPSEIPNPNHGGKNDIGDVQVHKGGITWDWSHGCLTGLNSGGYTEFDDLMKHLALNEIVNIFLS